MAEQVERQRKRRTEGGPRLKTQVWELWAQGRRAKEISIEFDIDMSTVYKWEGQFNVLSARDLADYYPKGSIPEILLNKWRLFHTQTELEEFRILSPNPPETYRFDGGIGAL
jgi:hypothetical protein